MELKDERVDQAIGVLLRLSRQLHLMRSTAPDDSPSLTHFTPGQVESSNSSPIFTPGVNTGPTFTKEVSN
jgi:hypothetical protein